MINIALIEDDHVLGPTLIELLEISGFKAKLFNTYSDFTSFTGDLSQFNVFISDFYLGDGTFREVSAKLGVLGYLSRTICMTAAVDESDLYFATANANCLIHKPFKYDTLIKAIQNCRVSV